MFSKIPNGDSDVSLDLKSPDGSRRISRTQRSKQEPSHTHDSVMIAGDSSDEKRPFDMTDSIADDQVTTGNRKLSNFSIIKKKIPPASARLAKTS